MNTMGERLLDKGHIRKISVPIIIILVLSSLNLLISLPEAEVQATEFTTSNMKLEFVRNITGHSSTFTDMVWNVNGSLLVTCSLDSTIKVWKTSDWTCLHTLTGHTSYVNRVIFNDNETMLYSISSAGILKVWDTNTWSLIQSIKVHGQPAMSMDLSPDQWYMATCSDDDTIKIWNTTTWTNIITLTGHTHNVFGVEYSPNGSYISSCSADKTIRIWSTESWTCVKVLSDHSDFVSSISWNTNGSNLVSASLDRSIIIWNTTTWSSSLTITGHTSGVRYAKIDPNEIFLASCGYDNTVRIWYLKNGSIHQILQGHTDTTWNICWNYNGSYLISGSRDRTMKLWKMTSWSSKINRDYNSIYQYSWIRPTSNRCSDLIIAELTPDEGYICHLDQNGKLLVYNNNNSLFWTFQTGWYGWLEASDVDDDGLDEIFICSADRNNYLLDNDGRLIWKRTMSRYGHGIPLITDIDGDGKKEYIATEWDSAVYSQSSCKVYCYGALNGSLLWTYTLIDDGTMISAGDIDNDGDEEILVRGGRHATNYGNFHNLRLYLLDSNGINLWNKYIPNEPCYVGFFNDFNNDGNKEVIINNGGIEILNSSTGNTVSTHTTNGNLRIADDFNGDGDFEFLTFDGSYLYLLNETYSVEWSLQRNGDITNVRVHDIDDDNKLEILAGSYNSNSFFVIENDGSILQDTILEGGTGSQVYITHRMKDIDNDGDLDMGVYNTNQYFYLYTLGPTNPSPPIPPADEYSEYRADEYTVALWHLNMGRGSVANDHSSYENDGIISDAEWVWGFRGNGLEFDGVDDFVVVPDSPELSGGQKNLTIEGWIFPYNVSGTQVIIGKNKDTYWKDWCFYIKDGKLAFTYESNNNEYTPLISNSNLSEEEWNYIAFTYNRTDRNVILYINGEPEGNSTLPTDLVDTSQPVYIGKAGTGIYNNSHYYGALDMIRISHTVRPSYEIKGYYELVNPPPPEVGGEFSIEEETVALWHFNETQGTTAFDETDYDNDGQVNGPSWCYGKFSNGLEFDGVDDYVVVPDSPELSGGGKDLTVEGWVFPYDVDQRRTFISKMRNSMWKDWGLFTREGKLGFQYEYRGNNQPQFLSVTTIPEYEWSYIAFTYNRTTKVVKLYLNGEYENSDTLPTDLPDTGQPVYIGKLGTGYYNIDFFFGVLDEFRISHIVKTPEEIKRYYQNSIDENNAPIADAGGPYSGYEGSAVLFDASDSSDEDGDILQYRWDFNNDEIWDTSYSSDPTASHTWNDEYSGTVVVEVYDGEDVSSDTASITVINKAPQSTFGNNGPKGEGSPVTFSFTDQHDPGTSDTFSYSFDWDSDGTFEIVDQSSPSASNIWYDEGTYTVTGRIKDNDGAYSDYTIAVTITNVAPTAILSHDGSKDEGSPVTFTFSDQYDPGTSDTFTYSFDWDNDETFEITDQSSSSASNIWYDEGTYTIKGRIKDNDGAYSDYTVSVIITNVAPTATLSQDGPKDEGSPVTFTFTDQNDPGTSDTFTYSFDWDNDGTFEIVDQSSPSASNTWYDEGTYMVKGRIKDNDGAYSDYTVAVTITNVAPTATLSHDGPKDEGSPVTFTFSDQYDPGTSDTFTYSFDWDNDGTFEITDQSALSASNIWYDEGTYTVKGRIKDNDGAYSDYTIDVTIINVAPTATLSHDGPKGEGSPVSFNFTDQYDPGTSDTFTYSFDWNSDGLFEIENSTSDCATHTWYDNGNIAITGRIYDNDGDYSEYTASVIILNIAPNVSFIVTLPDLFVVAGENITFNGSFTDPGTLDTHNITWIFGDETSQYGNLDVIHSYSNSGTFNVTLKITDDDGGVGTYQLQVIINSISDAINDLIDYIEDLNLDNGIDNSLDKKLENVQKSLDSLKNGNRSDAVNKLQAFINEVEAQSGNKINEEDAAELIEYAERLIAELKS